MPDTVFLENIKMAGQSTRRLDSSSERLSHTIFGLDNKPSEVEMSFLENAEWGDLASIQEAVQEQNVNINCQDHLGRSALELAVAGDHLALVEYLLPRCNMQAIDDALIYSISMEKVKICELILDHPLFRKNRLQLGNADVFYNHDIDSPKMRPNTTPIVMAAQKNNVYLIQLLIERGAEIKAPHDYFCDCIECSNMRMFDSVKYSTSRLNTYRAMASAAYISLSSVDPILTAFQLSHQLERLADIEKEYKAEYNDLSKQCKDYVVELLDLIRSTEEIMSIVNEDENAKPSYTNDKSQTQNLTRLKLALKNEQKRFIAHPTCQRHLIGLWYFGLPWMRHQHMIIKLLSVPVATLLLPILALAFLVAPGSRVGFIMRSPFVKFLNHTCAYIVFLILVFMATNRGGSGNPFLDMACQGVIASLPDSIVFILIFIWVLGMLMHECRQLFREGPRDYIYDWWNWMDSSLILLYLCYFSIQFVVFASVVNASMETKRHVCPNLTSDMSCREKQCEVDRAMRNWTTCYMGGSCEDIDNIYTPKGQDTSNIDNFGLQTFIGNVKGFDPGYAQQSALKLTVGKLSPTSEADISGDILDDLSDMHQISDIFFSLANVLSFARIAHLLPANEQLGPLLVSFGRMLHDVVRFGVVFILVFLSFMCGLTSLYRVHQCENNFFSRLDLSLSSLFWATFGMGDTKATQLDQRYLGTDMGLITTHTTHHPLTQIFGYALFWSYIAAAVVVLLNMLIAMMSNSFQEIYDDRDVEWKFARAKLWIDFFEGGCTLPTPFNLIPNPKYIVRIAQWIKHKCSKTRDDPPVQLAHVYARRKNGMTDGDISHSQLQKAPTSLYQRVSARLIQRYIYKTQCEKYEHAQNEHEFSDLKNDVTNLSSDVIKLRHEVGYITSSMAQSLRQRNGVRSNVSRIDLQV